MSGWQRSLTCNQIESFSFSIQDANELKNVWMVQRLQQLDLEINNSPFLILSISKLKSPTVLCMPLKLLLTYFLEKG